MAFFLVQTIVDNAGRAAYTVEESLVRPIGRSSTSLDVERSLTAPQGPVDRHALRRELVMASELARPVPDLRTDVSLESTSSTVRRRVCRSGRGKTAADHRRAATAGRMTRVHGARNRHPIRADGWFASAPRPRAITRTSGRLA